MIYIKLTLLLNYSHTGIPGREACTWRTEQPPSDSQWVQFLRCWISIEVFVPTSSMMFKWSHSVTLSGAGRVSHSEMWSNELSCFVARADCEFRSFLVSVEMRPLHEESRLDKEGASGSLGQLGGKAFPKGHLALLWQQSEYSCQFSHLTSAIFFCMSVAMNTNKIFVWETHRLHIKRELKVKFSTSKGGIFCSFVCFVFCSVVFLFYPPFHLCQTCWQKWSWRNSLSWQNKKMIGGDRLKLHHYQFSGEEKMLLRKLHKKTSRRSNAPCAGWPQKMTISFFHILNPVFTQYTEEPANEKKGFEGGRGKQAIQRAPRKSMEERELLSADGTCKSNRRWKSEMGSFSRYVDREHLISKLGASPLTFYF